MHWGASQTLATKKANIVPQPSPAARPRGGERGEGPQMFNHKMGEPFVLLSLTGTLTKSPYIVLRRMAGPTVGPTTSPFSRVRAGRRVWPGAFVYNLQTSFVISSGYD
jgi:hypothetical protein